jgi:hypothetical protein
VPWHSAILDFWRALADQNHVLESAGAGLFGPHVWTPLCSPCPQAGCEFFAQRSTGLHEERLVDRLVRNAHVQVVRMLADQPGRDLLRGPLGA